MSEIININNRLAAKPTPKELVFKYLPYLPLLIISLLLFLAGAYVKLRYSAPVYNVTGKILVKNDNTYGGGSDKFSNILMLPEDNTSLNDKIEVIKSRPMAARVVRALGLQQQYSIKGSILTSQAHSLDLPFQWVIEKVTDSLVPMGFTITIAENNQFKINESPILYNFGQLVQMPQVRFRLIPTSGTNMQAGSVQYILQWIPEQFVAGWLSGTLNAVKSEGSNVLNLMFAVENKNLGLDIINGYIREYQLSSLEDKQLIAKTTAQFIDEQLDTLQHELGGVERNLQNFREKNMVFSQEDQSRYILDQLSESTKELNTQSIKSKVLDYLIRYIRDDKNSNRLVPSNLGIEEPTLLQQITEFNTLQLKRESLLKTTTESNPAVANLNVSIENMRLDMLQNLQNVEASYNLSINELKSRSRETEENVRAIPAKEKQLLEVTRRQSILQELYSFLLQKKLETGISSASTISDIKMLEPAIANGTPVSPNRKGLYTIAVFLGLALPAVIIFLLDYFNDKVTTKNDIIRVTEAPILGEIGHVDNADVLVVKQNNRAYVAEQFRIVRSNLQYLIPKEEKPALLVTSSFSGEGKSFISTNLGAVLALSGKKTVILEMDIRKPKILKGLNMSERTGLTNYLIGDTSVSSITFPVPGVDNLFVIPCGPIPPNPAELLLDNKIQLLFSELKERFDAIIVDTAPVGLVSDAVTLGKYCNASVFIVRHNYTFKKQIPVIDNIYVDKKLPQLSIVINDIKTSIGGYYGYGYGYGLGSMEGDKNGNGYFDNEGRKKKRWGLLRLKK